jgi:hypothetical protein
MAASEAREQSIRRVRQGISRARGLRAAYRNTSATQLAVSGTGKLLFFLLLLGIVILKDILDPLIDLLISGTFALATAVSAATFGIAIPVAYGIVFFLYGIKVLIAVSLFILMVTYRFIRFMSNKSGIGGALRALAISSAATLMDSIPYLSILPWQTGALIVNEFLDRAFEKTKGTMKTIGGRLVTSFQS